MWDKTASYIREVAKEVLRASQGNHGGHQGDWWWNGKVQEKVEAKKAVYVKLIESKNEVEKWTNRELYKMARKEAKLAVMAVKMRAFECLYVELEEKDGDKKLYRLTKAMDKRARDLDHVRTTYWPTSPFLIESQKAELLQTLERLEAEANEGREREKQREVEMKQREDHVRAEINAECQKKMDVFMNDLQNKLVSRNVPDFIMPKL
ncbi:hypothetical protein RND71_012365 [Anisodus tanguticus]|uniref:Uncharacterized protein n=1 Tax=Anisodus tanguticus TaxID=243964 RepID=A0AAE1VFX6_9SOLA|nr:hypothetical protein RND71_012365 [Anisodus tanguticus]